MTSLGYSNVMNYFNGSYTVISYSYGFMEICPFFQSPDIITSHIPLSNITNPSWALSFLSPLSLPTSITHLSSVRPAGQVCKTDEQRVRCPLEFVWTPSSRFMLIEGWKLPKHLKPPNVRWQVMAGDDHIRGRDHVTVPGRGPTP